MNAKTFLLYKIFSSKFLLGILIVLVISLTFSQLLIANAFSEKGSDLRNIERKIEFLIKDNQQLRNQIGKQSSLKNIEKQAQDLGFITLDKSNIDYLSDPTLVLNR